MRLVVRPDAAAAACCAAALIARRIGAEPDIVLGLATGRTMEPVYAELVRLHRQQALDFARCRCFNLDEYVGLVAGDTHSYRGFMDRHLFSQVNVAPGRTRLPDGAGRISSRKPRATSARYATRAGSACSCSASARPAISASTNRAPRSPRAPGRWS